MPNIKSVSPFRVRMWDLHDRLESGICEETCRGEIESFARSGQIVPVLGRPLRNDPDYDIELICGARRLFVARHLKQDLLVELREMSDREALVAMDLENRQRIDISPYERGMSYARWLRSGHFQSQEDIARALKTSAAQVSRLIKLARLPAVVVDAFATPMEICETWGLNLSEALEDPQRRSATIQRARSLALENPRRRAAAVYRELLAASGKGRKVRPSSHDEVVKDQRGKPLFRVRQLRDTVALLLPVDKVPAKTMTSIRQTLAAMLGDTLATGSEPLPFRRPAPPKLMAVSRERLATRAVAAE